MTTLTLTIGGVDFLPRYKTNSAKIVSNIANQGDTLTLKVSQKTGDTVPTVGKEIIFKDGSRFLFGGFITKATPTEYGIGGSNGYISYTIEATDYTYVLTNKSVQTSYSNKTIKYIVDDLISNLDPGYGITDTNTPTGATIETINFNHISLRQALENIAKLTGYVWWVDYQKDIHFAPLVSGSPAPETFTDANPSNHSSMTISYDISQIRNDIIVIGGTQESANYSQEILGDAYAREWVLLYPVKNMISVELNTGAGYTTKVFGIDPKDDETGNDFMYNADRGSIRCTATTTTPGATHKIRVTYTYPLDVVAEVKSAPSIVAMKAIEGGDGIHSYTIQDKTIVSNGQAQARGLKELDHFAFPTLIGRVITRTGLLAAGSYFQAGQFLTINTPTYGINTDTTYMIQKVTTSLSESGGSVEYTYTIDFGGRNIGVVDFLQALATPETPLDLSGQVTKIQSVADVVTISEAINKNNNVRNITDTITFAEAISKANVTPPFIWGVNGTANKGVWGKSEWA